MTQGTSTHENGLRRLQGKQNTFLQEARNTFSHKQFFKDKKQTHKETRHYGQYTAEISGSTKEPENN